MTCDKCGTKLSADSKFCAECGNEILAPAQIICHNCQCSNELNVVFCSGCGAKLTNSTKRCVKCGCEIDNETIFCGECGTNQNTYIGFEENKEHTKKKEKPIKSKKYGLIISILVLIIIILLSCIVGYFYYIGTSNNNNSEIIETTINETSDDVQIEKEEVDNVDEVPTENEVEHLSVQQYVKNTDVPLNVRSEAKHESDLVVKIYDESELMSYYGESKQGLGSDGKLHDWYKITLKDGTSGWVRSDLVSSKTIDVDNKGYATYQNTNYGYACKYPSWFEETFKNGSILNCESKDGKAKMTVSTTNFGYTIQETIDNYISSYDEAEIDYKSVGDDYFAIRLKKQDNNMYYYRYSEFVDGLVHSFTLDFPVDEFQTYDEIINTIYADFSKQFN